MIKRIVVEVEEDLHHKFKLACMKARVSMRKFLLESIKKFTGEK